MYYPKNMSTVLKQKLETQKTQIVHFAEQCREDMITYLKEGKTGEICESFNLIEQDIRLIKIEVYFSHKVLWTFNYEDITLDDFRFEIRFSIPSGSVHGINLNIDEHLSENLRISCLGVFLNIVIPKNDRYSLYGASIIYDIIYKVTDKEKILKSILYSYGWEDIYKQDISNDIKLIISEYHTYEDFLSLWKKNILDKDSIRILWPGVKRLLVSISNTVNMMVQRYLINAEIGERIPNYNTILKYIDMAPAYLRIEILNYKELIILSVDNSKIIYILKEGPNYTRVNSDYSIVQEYLLVDELSI